MKLTREQANKILTDFNHFDGSKIKIKDGQVGQYPVVIILPFDEESYRRCVLDIFDRMRSGTQLIREYPSANGECKAEVFFYDLVPNDTIAKHTAIDKWLSSIYTDFDFAKYGLNRPKKD